MTATRLIVVGVGFALVLGIAVRATRAVGESKAALATVAARRATLGVKIARMEERLRAAVAAGVRSPKGLAAPLERPPGSQMGVPAVTAEKPNPGGQDGPAREGDSPAVMLGNPARLAAFHADYRVCVDVFYGGFFKALGMSSDQIGRFRESKVASAQGWLEFQAVVDQHGFPMDSPEREKLRQKEMMLNGVKLTEALGPTLYAAWRQYSRTQSVRDLVQRLSSTGAHLEEPVTSAQVERTTDILIANAKPREKNAFRGWAIDWNAAKAQLAEVLNPAQIATLGLFVEEQEASVKVTKRINRLTAQLQGKRPN